MRAGGMNDPKLLTVIVNYRTPVEAVEAAEAAARATEGIDGAVTIVDNASGDGSAEQIAAALAVSPAARDGRIQLIVSPRNGGYGAGNNLAIRMGLPDGRVPDFVYILNPDARPEADAVRRLLDALEADPRAAFAGSLLHDEEGRPQPSAFRFPNFWSEVEGGLKLGVLTRLLQRKLVVMPVPFESGLVDWLSGASLMMRRLALDEIGLFDETFFLYFEETELCWRARKAGWRVLFVRESRLMHKGAVSTGMKTWSRTPGYWFDSRLRYFTKCHGPSYAAAATLAHVLGAATWHVRRVIQRKPLFDPPHFVRDLARHAVRTALTRSGQARRRKGREGAVLGEGRS